jgi:hypothetical protein
MYLTWKTLSNKTKTLKLERKKKSFKLLLAEHILESCIKAGLHL